MTVGGQGYDRGMAEPTTVEAMIAALPESVRDRALAAVRRSQVEVLHRVSSAGGRHAVADALEAIAEAEGPGVANQVGEAWQASGGDWLDRQDALATPQAQARFHDRLALLAAEGHQWAVDQVASEGHRQAS